MWRILDWCYMASCLRRLRDYILYIFLTMHLDILCNENQSDALFIRNLFNQITSTCFGHQALFAIKTNQMQYLSLIYFINHLYMFRACLLPIIMRYSLYYIQQLILVIRLSWLAAGGVRMDNSIPTRPVASQLKRITRTTCSTYTVNTSWWWAINLPETCKGEWWNKLKINGASGWFLLQIVLD
jgi:hypothetical protein